MALTALCLCPATPFKAHAAGLLTDYVTRTDTSYHWDPVRSGRLGSGDYVEVILTSQTWRDIPWKHQLFLLRPKHIDPSSRQALLFIDGGRWKPEYESEQRDLPSEARVFARLAESAHALVAVVRQVPFQPLFDKREDALIAYTFDRYLETGEPDWPLLLPMVKSAVRAMDAVQSVAQQEWHLTWTSWLTAATDARVASVAPMVIDMLNLPEQIQLQRDTFGSLSDEVQDYDRIDLPGRIGSDRGRRLIEMVDPYSYRASLTLPKLVLLATNDRYWPLDALSLYWNGIPQSKRVLYIPNQGHGLRDVDRLLGALSAVHRYSARGEALPSLSWAFTATARKLELAVQPGRAPLRGVAWSATSLTRDFRDAHWVAHDCKRSRARLTCSEPTNPARYTALYSEITFRDRGEHDFALSTAVCIVDAAGTMVRPCLDNVSEGEAQSPAAAY
jgi:PhoPQ-activated pathogenicity-related protein